MKPQVHLVAKCPYCEHINDADCVSCERCCRIMVTPEKAKSNNVYSLPLTDQINGLWQAATKGMLSILEDLQSKTHVVKYCKNMLLPAIWETPEADFEDMRWFERVVTGLEYNFIADLQKQRASGFVPAVLMQGKSAMDLITERVLEINLYLPANHIYSIYVVVDTMHYAIPKPPVFNLEKILKSKLAQFQSKAMVMRYRGVGSQSKQPVIRIQQ